MSATATPIFAHGIASMLGWWDEMGVDMLVDEAPRRWSARSGTSTPPLPPAERSPDAATPRIATAKPSSEIMASAAPLAALPTTIEALRDWLMTSDAIPDAPPAAYRIGPSGDPASDLMVLLDMAEADDRDTLLSGELGGLFDRMLHAIGRSRADIYLASLLPGRPPSGLISDAVLPRLSEIARHHVALSAAKMVWVLGSAPSRAITGMNEISARNRLRLFNHNGRSLGISVSYHPRTLVANPKLKAGAWSDMQMMIKDMTA